MPEGVPVIFPPLRAENLAGEVLELPGGLAGRLNLVILAFIRGHRVQIETWEKCLQRLETSYPDFHYYELPVIARSIRREMGNAIDEGMRAGVPDPKHRGRIVTLYLEKEAFNRHLGIADESRIQLRLLDRGGRVHWSASGPMGGADCPDLERVLARV